MDNTDPYILIQPSKESFDILMQSYLKNQFLTENYIKKTLYKDKQIQFVFYLVDIIYVSTKNEKMVKDKKKTNIH